jgi:nucleoside-diphosphate-sugar epimerase
MGASGDRTVVLGATGPTGIHLARALVGRGRAVRVVARTEERLRETFPDLEVELHAADLARSDAALGALDGCALAFDCVGLPPAQMQLHPVVARSIAGALRATGARCVQVSSYWSYLPVQRLPVNEEHPREGGPGWARLRREAEDVLLDAGAAVLHLPDFFGPWVHTSSLQNALVQALDGKTMDFLGASDLERDYLYVPDVVGTALALAEEDAAFGARWPVPGSGPISARELVTLCTELLGREVRARGAPLWMVRVLSLFSGELRAFLPMARHYAQPVRYDASRLVRLVGPLQRTPYGDALATTFGWLRDVRGGS